MAMRKMRWIILNILHLPVLSMVLALFILGLVTFLTTSEREYETSGNLSDNPDPGDEEIPIDAGLLRRADRRVQSPTRRWGTQLQQHLERVRDIDEEAWRKRVDLLYYDVLDGDPFELQQLGIVDEEDVEYYDDDTGVSTQYHHSRSEIQEESRNFINIFGAAATQQTLRGVDSETRRSPATAGIESGGEASAETRHSRLEPAQSQDEGETWKRLSQTNAKSLTYNNSNQIDSSHKEKVLLSKTAQKINCAYKKNRTSAANIKFYQIPHLEMFLYSAFLDAHHSDHKYIRIFGVQNRTQPTDLHCSVYTGSQTSFQLLQLHGIFPAYSKWPTEQAVYLAYQYGYHITDSIWNKITQSDRHVLECWVDGQNKVQIPFEIVPQGPLSNDIVVCVRAIWGNVDKYRLIEWIEFQKLLGVVGITFYSQILSEETAAILDFYERQAIVTTRKGHYMDTLWSYIQHDPVGGRIRHREWLMEQVYLVNVNDCLYRYSKTHKFVLVMDIDEFLLPSSEESLAEMIQRLRNDLPLQSAYLFPTVWHFTQFGSVRNKSEPERRHSGQSPANDIQSLADIQLDDNIYQLLHTQNYLRRTEITQSQPKSVFVSGTFITANWHGTHVINKDLIYQGNYAVSGRRYGILHHYRDGCKYKAEKCEKILAQWTVDEWVSMYRDPLSNSFLRVLKLLHSCFNISVVT